MKLSEVEVGGGQVRRIPSAGRCIYCGDTESKLTEEHVIPYALAANTLILEGACCTTCQQIIQRYEQEVLAKQLGTFRAQVGAPSRTKKKDRPTHAEIECFEVNEQMEVLRRLGVVRLPNDEAPLRLALWQSPPPRAVRIDKEPIDEEGKPWVWTEQSAVQKLRQRIENETGAKHIMMHAGDVNRLHYLRALAKTAHAYAVAEIGLDGFEPCLLDLILNRSDDVAEFVGNDPSPPPIDNTAHTVQIFLGEALDGPAKGMVVVRIQLYPDLRSPAHMIVVGKSLIDIEAQQKKRFGTPSL